MDQNFACSVQVVRDTSLGFYLMLNRAKSIVFFYVRWGLQQHKSLAVSGSHRFTKELIIFMVARLSNALIIIDQQNFTIEFSNNYYQEPYPS